MVTTTNSFFRSRWLFLLAGIHALLSAPGHAQWFDQYRSLAEYNQRLSLFASDYPTLASPVTLGTSYEGRTIEGIRITGTGTAAVAKKAVFLDGLMHAREWIAGMVPMYIADRLLATYGSDPRVTWVLDNVEFIIAPVVNPDGYEYSRDVNRQWRKNRRANPGGSFGVDLNRNFGVGWGMDSGSSGNPVSETYRGTAPFSEPETQAIRDTMLSNQHIVSYINFHSYSQLILHPWGYTTQPAPDEQMLVNVAGRMAASIHSVHGQVYEFGDDAFLYLSSGVARDWAYGDQGAYSYTVELRPTTFNPGFELPPDQIIPTSEEIFPAMLDLAEFTISLAGGDFNNDGFHDCLDIDRLVESIVDGSNRAERDLTGDGQIDALDLADWLTRAGAQNLPSGNPFLSGDANLDGIVDGSDFNIWNSNKFASTSSWCSGDFNADGVVDGSDFNLWNANKFTSSDGGTLVPEPVIVFWLLWTAVACRRFVRQKYCSEVSEYHEELG